MKIPKTFHRIWIGNTPMPEEYEYYGQTFMDLHPDWEYKLWTDDNLPVEKFQNRELYESDDGVVFKANIARIEILYAKWGSGVYADCDFEFYKNIEPLINDLDYFFTGEKYPIIGNALIGSIPNNPILKMLLDGMEESSDKNKDYPPTVRNGVIYQSQKLDINRINYLEPKLFFPTPPGTYYPSNKSSDFPNSYAHHHWKGSWCGVEGKKDYGTWRNENIDKAKKLKL